MQAIRIHGTTKTIQRLVRLCKQAAQEGAYRVARRLHAVVLNMEGRTAPEIAGLLKVHCSTVSLWLRHWQQQGMDGILEGHRSGRPKALSEHQWQTLVNILDSGPVAYGFPSGVWTCPMVARVIEAEFSVADHPVHVSHLLHHLEFSVQRPRKILARADQDAQSRWVRDRYPDIKKSPQQRGCSPLRSCSSLSSTTGIPKGRSLSFPFGIHCRRTNFARYRFCLSRSTRLRMFAVSSRAYSCALTRSTPLAACFPAPSANSRAGTPR